jgi:serine protease Do
MKSERKKHICISVIGLLILFFCHQTAITAPIENSDIDLLNKTGDAISQIAQNASSAVVSVRVEKMVKVQNFFDGNGLEDPFEQFFGKDFQKFFNERGGPGEHFFRFETPMPQSKQIVRGLGSGFIVESNGYIITNNHVVSDTDKVIVKLTNGTEYTAKVIGADASTDLAVVKVEAEGLPTLEMGDSDALKVGQWVVAIGNPFGLTSTVTVGVVSAKGRAGIGIEDYEDFIQTDAAINLGNSGGPLLNAYGKVIGINTAIVSGYGGSVGVGFAIPSNMAKTIYKQLKENGAVTRGYIGIVIQPLTPDLAKYFNISEEKGILISQVMKDSPGEKAGLKSGDIIIKMNEHPVKDITVFRNNVAMTAPGTKIELTITRGGKEDKVVVTIEKLPSKAKQKVELTKPAMDIGLTVQNLTSDLAAQFGYKGEKGVIISFVEPGSPADEAGLKVGMLIEQVGQKTVTDVDEFQAEIQKEAEKGSILMLIRSKDYNEYVVIKLK